MSIDPLAADYPSITPYNYALNNPIIFFDRDGLSSFKFDGSKSKLYFYDKDNNLTYTLNAHNKVASGYKKWEDGTYDMKDTKSAYTHGEGTDKKGVKLDSENGSYGKKGILRAEDFKEFDGTERTGMGVHAGRENLDFNQRVTYGCIRVESASIFDKVLEFIKKDPLMTITISNNREWQSKAPQAKLNIDNVKRLTPKVIKDNESHT